MKCNSSSCDFWNSRKMCKRKMTVQVCLCR
nr:MAG TPA: hypothetical protein [Herelleviridae sp.]